MPGTAKPAGAGRAVRFDTARADGLTIRRPREGSHHRSPSPSCLPHRRRSTEARAPGLLATPATARSAPPRAQLPPLLHRPGRVGRRHVDAAGRPGLARAHPHRQRRGARHQPPRCSSAPARARPLGRRGGRPAQPPPADHLDPDHPGRASRHPRGAHPHRDRRALDGLRPRPGAGHRHRLRHPGPPGLRRRDGRAGELRQRTGAELHDPQRRAARGSGDRRPADRDDGRRVAFAGQRGVLRRRPHRPAAHRPGKAPAGHVPESGKGAAAPACATSSAPRSSARHCC